MRFYAFPLNPFGDKEDKHFLMCTRATLLSILFLPFLISFLLCYHFNFIFSSISLFLFYLGRFHGMMYSTESFLLCSHKIAYSIETISPINNLPKFSFLIAIIFCFNAPLTSLYDIFLLLLCLSQKITYMTEMISR